MQAKELAFFTLHSPSPPPPPVHSSGVKTLPAQQLAKYSAPPENEVYFTISSNTE